MNQNIRTLILPVAMLVGFLFSGFFAALNPSTPYILFTMLFITFCRISPSEMRFLPMIVWLILMQVAGGVGVYLLLSVFDETVAQGVAMCIYAPTAVAAMVIGGMLGANLATMATMTFFSNLTVGILSPFLFSFVGQQTELPFFDSFLAVIGRVGPLLLIPLFLSMLLRKVAPKVHAAVRKRQDVSFYLWVAALAITTGQTVEFVIEQDSGSYTIEIIIAAGAFAACILQFAAGRRLGRKYGDRISGGQSLGQKNTLLAIWMAQTYFHPLSSLGPASYVLWQNLVNTWQLWRHRENNSPAQPRQKSVR